MGKPKTTTTLRVERKECLTLTPDQVSAVLREHFKRSDAVVDFDCGDGYVNEVTITTTTVSEEENPFND